MRRIQFTEDEVRQLNEGVLVQREMEFCLLQISYFGACLSDIV